MNTIEKQQLRKEIRDKLANERRAIWGYRPTREPSEIADFSFVLPTGQAPFVNKNTLKAVLKSIGLWLLYFGLLFLIRGIYDSEPIIKYLYSGIMIAFVLYSFYQLQTDKSYFLINQEGIKYTDDPLIPWDKILTVHFIVVAGNPNHTSDIWVQYWDESQVKMIKYPIGTKQYSGAEMATVINTYFDMDR